jgi:AmpD protein
MDSKVSAHFLIRRDGELIQFVSCAHRAWHAGVSSWRGRIGMQRFFARNRTRRLRQRAFADAQYQALIALLDELRAAAIPSCDVVGHSDVAPGRKTDPGPCFDWKRLHDSRS